MIICAFEAEAKTAEQNNPFVMFVCVMTERLWRCARHHSRVTVRA